MSRPDDTLALIARRITAARERLGLSQDELGAASGLHRNTVSRIERAEHGLTLATTVTIARALGVSVSELIGELDARERPAPKVSAVARRLHEVIDELPQDAQRALLEVAELLRRPK